MKEYERVFENVIRVNSIMFIFKVIILILKGIFFKFGNCPNLDMKDIACF